MKVFKGFFVKELTQMVRNPVMVFALLVMPLVQCFLLSYSVSNEARDLNIVVSAPENDLLMRRIYEHCISTDLFVPVAGHEQMKVESDPFGLVERNEADLVLVAPPEGLTNMLRSGKQADVQALIDASNVLTAQSISGFLQSIVNSVIQQELTGDTAVSTSSDIPIRDAGDNHTPVLNGANTRVNFATRILFNPEMNTKFFIVPSIMGMVVSSAIFSLVCISITKEKENGTIETLISAPIRKIDILLGKTLPYFVIAFTNFCSVCALGLWVFRLPFRGAVWMLILTFFLFCFAMSMLGVFISNFCGNQQQALLGVMMTMFIMMMLSGSMFPVETMPTILKIFANINPLTHFNYLLRNIVLKGCSLHYFLEHSTPMLLFGSFFGAVGIKQLKQTI